MEKIVSSIPGQKLIWNAIKKSLIVSCQVQKGSTLDRPDFLAAMAQAVEEGGACAIRAEGIENVKLIAKSVKVPVIGLIKDHDNDSPVYITPKPIQVKMLEDVGATLVAVDATSRIRPNNMTIKNFYEEVKKITDVPLLADIDDVKSALNAESLGFDAIATTLSGYTEESNVELPDLNLVKELGRLLKVPLVAEGGYATSEQILAAFQYNAWSVCVGTAITNPYLITRQITSTLEKQKY